MERPVGYRVTLSVKDGFVFGLGLGLAFLALHGFAELVRTLLTWAGPLVGS